jgi:hypothetical protein
VQALAPHLRTLAPHLRTLALAFLWLQPAGDMRPQAQERAGEVQALAPHLRTLALAFLSQQPAGEHVTASTSSPVTCTPLRLLFCPNSPQENM